MCSRQGRPDNVNGSAQTGALRFEKSLELFAVALPPRARIEPRQQTRQPEVHNASNRAESGPAELLQRGQPRAQDTRAFGRDAVGLAALLRR